MMTWEQAVQWLHDQVDQKDLVQACYFDDPIFSAAERFWSSVEWKSVNAYLPLSLLNNRALDLGAGRGISSYALAKDGWQVTALEPDPSDIVGAGAIRELAKQSGLTINVVTEFSEQLPFPNNHFDLVNGRQVLHHARDLYQTCREIHRVLKPGAMMIATREHVISKKQDLQLFLDSHPLHKFYGGENAFLLDEYLSAIQSAGLIIKKVLAPYDSPINYFPMTAAQHFEHCTREIARLFGSKLTKILFNQKYFFGKWFMNKLVSAANTKNQEPGRLYSFIAVKPG